MLASEFPTKLVPVGKSKLLTESEDHKAVRVALTWFQRAWLCTRKITPIKDGEGNFVSKIWVDRKMLQVQILVFSFTYWTVVQAWAGEGEI